MTRGVRNMYEPDIHPAVARAFSDTATLTRFVWRAIGSQGQAPADLTRALTNAEITLWDAIQLHHGVCTCEAGLGYECPSLPVHEDLYNRLHDQEEAGRLLGEIDGPMADEVLWTMDVVIRHI